MGCDYYIDLFIKIVYTDNRNDIILMVAKYPHDFDFDDDSVDEPEIGTQAYFDFWQNIENEELDKIKIKLDDVIIYKNGTWNKPKYFSYATILAYERAKKYIQNDKNILEVQLIYDCYLRGCVGNIIHNVTKSYMSDNCISYFSLNS